MNKEKYKDLENGSTSELSEDGMVRFNKIIMGMNQTSNPGKSGKDDVNNLVSIHQALGAKIARNMSKTNKKLTIERIEE